MAVPKPEPLCRYHYDPLDRLASCLPLGQADTRCFYRLNRLTTEIQGQVRTSWLQAQDQLLAQWQQEAKKSESLLIATDISSSVLHAISTDRQHAFVYMPYGVRQPGQAPLHLPGFNGERLDTLTGHYWLGNGVRAFNPVLMRFNSPDSLSPFGKGGINAYGYCGGDPVNQIDPSGHMFGRLSKLLQGPQRSVDDTLTLTIGKDAGILGTAYQSLNRNTESVLEIPAPRLSLQRELGPDQRATPFGARLAAVNDNLASHGNPNLSPRQAADYASLAQKVSSEEISNTTAHLRAAVKWLSQVPSGPFPQASIIGFTFNTAIAITTAGAEAGARKTGAAIRGGSTLNGKRTR